MNPIRDCDDDFGQQRVKCLLVDDLEENLLALSALLQQENVEILTATSGSQALDVLLEHDVALALLDVQMPDMDGFELAELIRGSSRTRHIPLVFVTAGSRDQHRVFKGYETGAVDFLYKPIDPYILRSKADVFFQLYRQKQQLAQELAERTETLRLAETFVAMISHDLRTPVSAMLMSAHLVKRHSQDQVVQEAVARMLASGKHMTRMIDDMLDLARIRLGGGMVIKKEETRLEPVVLRAVQEHRMATPGREIVLRQQGEFDGLWDVHRLSQVVSNLVGNALQHGSSDRPIEVEIDGTQADTVVLRVTNGGVIAREVLPYMFDPFRGGTHADRHGGLGLGLYIVQQIVQAHGGQVEVRSGGAATCFEVAMPRRLEC